VLAVKLVGTLVNILSIGFSAPSRPQDESKAHYYEKQSNEELAIDWLTQDAASIIALINACNPHNKGAATKINAKLIRLLQAENIDYHDESRPPGTIISLDDEYMDIAVIGGQRLRVRFVYIAEGFLPPNGLHQFGLLQGLRFENIY
jgi:methionyl-tRNA formyltransferase